MPPTSSPSDQPETDPAALEARACPACGLTAADFAREGRMGCARCYEAFAPMVEEAVVRLHGVTPRPPAPAPERPALPWPTRRAAPAPAPAPGAPTRRPDRKP